MKVEEIVKTHKHLERDFKKAGISAKLYDNPPLRKEVFTIGVEDNVLRIWPGEGIDLKPIFDPKLRQAVLRIEEGVRSFSTEATIVVSHRVNSRIRTHSHLQASGSWGQLSPICDPMTCKTVAAAIARDVRSRLSLPKGTKVDLKKASWVNPKNRWRLKYEAMVTAPSTSTSFLVGIDETSHFVSQLPGHPSSVRTARESLRPTEVPKGALRQGEWFFTPCTEEETAAIWAEISNPQMKSPRRYYGGHNRVNPGFHMLEGTSSHRVAMGLKLNGIRYANGLVYDTREGRHEPLVLDGWHRVHRNNEVVQAVPRARSNRSNGPRWD